MGLGNQYLKKQLPDVRFFKIFPKKHSFLKNFQKSIFCWTALNKRLYKMVNLLIL